MRKYITTLRSLLFLLISAGILKYGLSPVFALDNNLTLLAALTTLNLGAFYSLPKAAKPYRIRNRHA